MTRRVAAAAASAAALVVCLGGCTAPAPTQTSLRGVSVVLIQYRSDIAPHRVQIEVVNDSRHAVSVASATLSGGYAPEPAWRDSSPARIGAGMTVDLPATLTRPLCTGAPVPRVRLRLADGTNRTVPTTDSHGTLAALRRSDCFAQRVAEVASVSFSGFRAAGSTAELVLSIARPRGSAEGLTISQVQSTPLLSPADGQDQWRLGRRFTSAGRVTLRAEPTRCDLHAIAEDKVGSVLPVSIRLADGTTGTINAVGSSTVRAAVLDWVVRACGH